MCAIRTGPEPPMQIYLPHSQFPTSFNSIVVKTAGEPMSSINAIRREILAVDKDQAVFNVTYARKADGRNDFCEKVLYAAAACFRRFGLTLAAIGIYGVRSYVASQRTMNRHSNGARGPGERRFETDHWKRNDAGACRRRDWPRRCFCVNTPDGGDLIRCYHNRCADICDRVDRVIAVALLACYSGAPCDEGNPLVALGTIGRSPTVRDGSRLVALANARFPRGPPATAGGRINQEDCNAGILARHALQRPNVIEAPATPLLLS